jgi:hypothetical protein
LAGEGSTQLQFDVFSQQPGMSIFALQAAVRMAAQQQLAAAGAASDAESTPAAQRQRRVVESVANICNHAAVAASWLTSEQQKRQASDHCQQGAGIQAAKTDHAAALTLLLSAFKAQAAAVAATAAEPCWELSREASGGTCIEQQGWQLQQRLLFSMELACSTLHAICQEPDAAGFRTGSGRGSSSDEGSSSGGSGSSSSSTGGDSSGNGSSGSSSGQRSSVKGATAGELQVLQIVLVAHSLKLLGQTMEAVMQSQQAKAVQAAELLLQCEVTVGHGLRVGALDCTESGWLWLHASLEQLRDEASQEAAAAAARTAAAATAAEGATQDAASVGTKLALLRLLQQCDPTVVSMARICWDHYKKLLLQCHDNIPQQQGAQNGGNEAAAKKKHRSTKTDSTILKLAKQMQQLGAAVISTLPLPYCCSNPSCRNLDELSEQELVAGSRCSGCKVARYCSKECQAQHWGAAAGHKALCKRL